MRSGIGEFREGWKVVLAAAIGSCVGLNGALVYTLGVFLLPLSEEFHWSRAQVSACFLFMMLGAIVTAPVIGRLADKVGVRIIALISLFTLAIALVCMTRINGNILNYYLALFLLSLAGCGTTAIVWSRGVAAWFDKRRGLAFALALTGTGVSGVISPILINALIERYDWRGGYIGLAGLVLLAIVPIFLLFFDRDGAHSGTARLASVNSGISFREALGKGRFWQLTFVFFIITAATGMMLLHLIPIIVEAGISRHDAAQIAGFLGVAVITGRLGTGFLVDRISAPFLTAGCFLITTGGCLIFSMAPHSGLWIGIATMAVGITAGAEIDLLPYFVSRYFGLKAYGQIYGFIFMIYEIGAGGGPLLAGYLHDLQGSYHYALYLAAAGFGIGAVVIAFFGQPPQVFKLNESQ
jgi:MFS family permease